MGNPSNFGGTKNTPCLAAVLGTSWLYGAGGSMSIDAFALALSSSDTMTRVALVLVLLALFVKGAIAPVHAWAPDA